MASGESGMGRMASPEAIASVAIARAVYFNAKILIMDEPTAALGPHETQMVAELIQEDRKSVV